MENSVYLKTLWLMVVSAVSIGLAFLIRDFDFEGKLGVGIGALLIGFLAITYIPLMIIYMVKRRNGTLPKRGK